MKKLLFLVILFANLWNFNLKAAAANAKDYATLAYASVISNIQKAIFSLDEIEKCKGKDEKTQIANIKKVLNYFNAPKFKSPEDVTDLNDELKDARKLPSNGGSIPDTFTSYQEAADAQKKINTK